MWVRRTHEQDRSGCRKNKGDLTQKRQNKVRVCGHFLPKRKCTLVKSLASSHGPSTSAKGLWKCWLNHACVECSSLGSWSVFSSRTNCPQSPLRNEKKKLALLVLMSTSITESVVLGGVIYSAYIICIIIIFLLRLNISHQQNSTQHETPEGCNTEETIKNSNSKFNTGDHLCSFLWQLRIARRKQHIISRADCTHKLRVTAGYWR